MAGRLRMWRPKFPLYHIFSNLSSKISHKNAQIFYPDFVHYSILQSAVRCDNILVSRGGEPTQVGSGCADKGSAMDEPLLSKL